jgi:hypothetical protein
MKRSKHLLLAKSKNFVRWTRRWAFLLLIIANAVGAFVQQHLAFPHHHHAPGESRSTSFRCRAGLSMKRCAMKRPSFLQGEQTSAKQQQEEYLAGLLLQESAGTSSSRTQPTRYVRWSPAAALNDNEAANGRLRLQTAITTWTRNDQKLFLHAQVHVGSPEYYDYYRTDPTFDDARTTTVLYELLVDDTLLTYDEDFANYNDTASGHGSRGGGGGLFLGRILHQVVASEKDQALAKQYGWVCQANRIDYARRNWYHADFTRQEYYARLRQRPEDSRPVVQEAATALFVGPPLSSNRASRRRIFTNLFLPGNSFALFLRVILWVAVPSPELSILLLDWSSTFWQQREEDQRRASMSSSSIHSNKPSSSSFKGQISPIAQAVLQSLAYGKWNVARQLVFGQVLIAGHKAVGLSATDTDTASMGERNDRALAAVDETFRRRTNGDNVDTVHLLYGCNHCPDLHQKLQARGFTCVSIDWRTVWTASIGDDDDNLDAPTTKTATRVSDDDDDTRWKSVFCKTSCPRPIPPRAVSPQSCTCYGTSACTWACPSFSSTWKKWRAPIQTE